MIRPTGFLSTVTIRDVDEQRRKSPNHVRAPRPRQALVALVSPAMARARPARGRDCGGLSGAAGHGLRRDRRPPADHGTVGEPATAGRVRADGFLTAAVRRPRVDHRFDDCNRFAAMSGGDPQQLAAAAAVLAIATGLVCLTARLLRAGYLSTLLSRPILVGYLVGIAVLMVASQLGHLTGLPVPHGSVLEQVAYVLTRTSEINVATVLMATGTLAVLFVGSRLFPRLPWTLIAMLLAAGVASLAHLERYGVQLVGPIPAGWPRLMLPQVSWNRGLSHAAAPAIGLALVA